MIAQSGINKCTLLNQDHGMVAEFFECIPDFYFLKCMNCICNGKGWAYNDVSCNFTDASDNNEITHEEVEILVDDCNPVYLKCTELLYYVRIASKHYCERHPEDISALDKLINCLELRCTE